MNESKPLDSTIRPSSPAAPAIATGKRRYAAPSLQRLGTFDARTLSGSGNRKDKGPGNRL